ncbi:MULTISPECIES: DUF5063 domain-containing protein [unclassified Nocardia]|uniref:DUF5063 domain-containing protein n=1 Tax=unclassified Nocardia TaxID=2637762 RepID=UPI0033A0C418
MKRDCTDARQSQPPNREVLAVAALEFGSAAATFAASRVRGGEGLAEVGRANHPYRMSEKPPEVETFVGSAREYCAVVEGLGGEWEPAALARALVPVLAGLVAAGCALPQVEPTSTAVPDFISRDRWFERFERLSEVLGRTDHYWSNLDLTTEAPVSAGSLADDLTDIWRDLRHGLDALDTGSNWRDVVFEWRLSFIAHWGRHAVDALRPLHAALRADLLRK